MGTTFQGWFLHGKEVLPHCWCSDTRGVHGGRDQLPGQVLLVTEAATTVTHMGCILKTPLLMENIIFFSLGKGGLISLTAYTPNAMDKPAIDFVKLNEAFLSSKQSFDFPNSCPSSHFLGPLSASHCLWMGIRHFLRLLPFPPGYINLFNRDKTVRANFATLIFHEATGKVLLTCNYGYVTYNIYVEGKKRGSCLVSIS